MNPDDTVCFCFHVSYRKLRNYAKHHKPQVASLMSECLGAGTGCGWCRPIICNIWSIMQPTWRDWISRRSIFSQSSQTLVRLSGK